MPRKPKAESKNWREMLPKTATDNNVIALFDKTPEPRKKDDVHCPHFWELKYANGCRFDCQWCMDGETMILRSDLSWSKLKTLKEGDTIIGFEKFGSTTKFKTTTIQKIQRVIKPRLKLTTDKATVICSYNHKFLSALGRWTTAKHLGTSDTGINFLSEPTERTPENAAYMAGYLHGITDGDGTMGEYHYKNRQSVHSYRLAMNDKEAILRATKYFKIFDIDMNIFNHNAGSGTPLTAIRKAGINNYNKIMEIFKTHNTSNDYRTGYIAGIFDAEGSFSGSNLRISNTNINILEYTKKALTKLKINSYIENFPPHCPTLRINGGVKVYLKFFNIVNPAIKRKWPKEFSTKFNKTSPVQKTERLEPGELIDIQTGTENFIANGLAAHNCFLNGTYRYNETGKQPRHKDPEEIKKKLERVLEAATEPLLFNAGEVGDALLYPTILLQDIIPLFLKYREKGHKLLLLTKDDDRRVMREAAARKAQDVIIFAYSINATRVAEDYGLLAPPPRDRLAACGEAQRLGFPTRIRLDPMVPVTGWKHAYTEAVRNIMQLAPDAEVITLGSLRGLVSTIECCKRNGKDISWTQYLTENSNWGKRPGIDISVEMYTHAIEELRKYRYKGEIALCKETLEIWKKMKNLLGNRGDSRCNCIL